LGAVQTSIAVDAFRRARVDGRRPGPAAGFGLVYVYRCRALSSARIFSFLTVVVLLLLVAEGLVCGRVGRDWVAIRGMEVAAETIGIRPLRTKLLVRIRDRPLVPDINAKGVLRVAALTTLKLPLSYCIFRPVASSERTGGGQ
jgi:hypothetical protein